jgi:hypothetical protein
VGLCSRAHSCHCMAISSFLLLLLFPIVYFKF